MNRNTGKKSEKKEVVGRNEEEMAVETAHAKPYSGQELAVFWETKAEQSG